MGILHGRFRADNKDFLKSDSKCVVCVHLYLLPRDSCTEHAPAQGLGSPGLL